MFCGRNTPKVTVTDVREVFQEYWKLGTIFFVYAGSHYFVVPVAIQTNVVGPFRASSFVGGPPG